MTRLAELVQLNPTKIQEREPSVRGFEISKIIIKSGISLMLKNDSKKNALQFFEIKFV